VVLPYFSNVWSRNPWLSSTTVSRTTSLRFPKRCHIFLCVRKQFCLKTNVYKHSDTFTKAGRSHEGKTENTAVVFFLLLALSPYLPFIQTAQTCFSHIIRFESEKLLENSDISTMLCKVSAREEHKQENVAFHTRATCVHPTINKQPSMLSFERLNYNESFKTCPQMYFFFSFA